MSSTGGCVTGLPVDHTDSWLCHNISTSTCLYIQNYGKIKKMLVVDHPALHDFIYAYKAQPLGS